MHCILCRPRDWGKVLAMTVCNLMRTNLYQSISDAVPYDRHTRDKVVVDDMMKMMYLTVNHFTVSELCAD